MIKLGVSAFYHDSAACLTIDGNVVAAVEEERFTEVKHDSTFPINSISWILEDNNLTVTDIDEIHWYENPQEKDNRVKTIFNKRPFKTFFLRRRYNKDRKNNSPENLFKNLGYTGKIIYHSHHESHAAFTYFTSPYNEAAILTVDGVGEWETITISKAKGNKIDKLLTINFPNSLGMLYSTITSYLGFKPNEGEYKVMGLAPYGNPDVYLDKLNKLFYSTDNKFWIHQKYFTWEYSEKIMFNKKLCQLLEIPPRLPEETLTQEHKDLAAALQKVYEQKFLKLVKTAKNITRSTNLCIGGGCAYNGVANYKAYKYFKSVHIPFAPSDAGSAIGACLDKHTKVTPYLGPSFSNNQVRRELQNYKNKLLYFNLSEEKLINKVGGLLQGQNVVAWFQGKMEFGARALGNRSILASAKNAKMREKLNHVIKKREGFRPFAPSVLEEQKDWFGVVETSPFMNLVSYIRGVGRQGHVIPFPAATHINRTARVQTVNKTQNLKFYKLLSEIKRREGVGVLLNTSYNLKDQTITMTPKQAIERYLSSDIDFLVINNFLIKKHATKR
jgi:carbamoyltransferase|tara:strand:+ start:837 stop:2507 length:1671 start_codon:yes stop_codon:yes gene_type:complete